MIRILLKPEDFLWHSNATFVIINDSVALYEIVEAIYLNIWEILEFFMLLHSIDSRISNDVAGVDADDCSSKIQY